MVCVSEAGLNLLVMQSRKKEAMPFKWWIASEVLPQIRKTGSYSDNIDQAARNHLSEIVKMRCHGNRGRMIYLWQQHNNHFGIASYHNLPAKKVKESETFLWNYPLDDPQEKISDVFNCHRETVGVYLNRLRDEVKVHGGILPKTPNIDAETICQAFIQEALLHNRFVVTFDEHGNPRVKLIPRKSWIITEDNIADIISDPCGISRSKLPEIMNAVMKRLGFDKREN